MKPLLNSSLFWLLLVLFPTFAVIGYNDYQERLLESNPIVGGIEQTQVKSVMLAKKLKDPATCLAENLYHESRGEPTKGQIATANVTLTRANYEHTSVCKTVYAPKQFSWTNNPSPVINEEAAYLKAEYLANEALARNLPVVVGTADHYYAEWINPPTWSKPMKYIGKVGQHLYFDSKQKPVKHDKRPTKAKPKPPTKKA